MSAQTTEIRLFGQRLVLKAVENPEIVKDAVRLAEAKLRTVERKSSSLPPHHAVLLALLDLATDHVKAKRRAIAYQADIDRKTTQLFQIIESELR